jgi:DNA-binding MarR family transcriptional regulator
MDQDNHPSRQNFDPRIARLVLALRANQAATDLHDECVVQFLGINRTDGRCLDIVDRLGRVTAGQLAAQSGLTTGAVTSLVDRMESAGYMRRVRDPNDRRKVWIEVTEQTRKINGRLFGDLMAISSTLFEFFSPGELEAIRTFLEAGAWINQERARLLRDHLPPSNADAADRLVQARAYERAAQPLSRAMSEKLRTTGVPDDLTESSGE